MTKKKIDIYMDNTATAFANSVVGIEEIEHLIKKPLDMPDFLLNENIELLKQFIDTYQNRHLLFSEKDRPLYAAYNRIKQNNNERTLDDTKILERVAIITKKQTERKKLIGYLNQTEDNPFMVLIKNNSLKETTIDTLNQEWIDRSYYVEVQSANFLTIANALEKIECYFSALILEDKTLPNLFKKYKIQIDILSLAKKCLNLIQEEKENLSHAMLLRLKLARLGLADDALLATIESLRPFWNFDCFKQRKLYFCEEALAPSLFIPFYSYIQGIGNKKQMKALHALYSITCSDVTQMASFIKNNYTQFPFYEGFTWNKMDFTKINLIEASFESGCIKNACMREGNFKLSNFNKCTFNNVTIQQANFTCSNFSNAKLQWIYAKNAICIASDLDNTSFHGSYLWGAKFERTKLNKTDFSMTNLQKATFYGAVGSCNFDGADLTETNLIGVDISKISFQGAILIDTQFIGETLETDILLELDVLACRIKNHASEAELRQAIKQNVINKIINMPLYQNNEELGLRESKLLQHALFNKKDDSLFAMLNYQTENAFSFFKKSGAFVSSQIPLKPFGI